MVPLDPTQIDILRKCFPSLNDTKVDVLLLFSCGMPKKMIAKRKELSFYTVDNYLRQMAAEYGLEKVDYLRSLFLTRVMVYMLS